MEIFEMFGLPGSGKTTKLASVKEKLIKGGQNVYTIRDLEILYVSNRYGFLSVMLPRAEWRQKLFYFTNSLEHHKVQFLISQFDLHYYVNKYLDKHQTSEKEANLLKEWFLELGGYIELAKKLLNEKDILLLDEGFYQRVISIFAFKQENPSTSDVMGYLSRIPAIRKVFFVDVNPDVCIDRFTKRGMSIRLKNAKEGEFKVFYQNAVNLIQLCIENTKADVHTIKN
jgi:hypothetical protein